MCGDGDTIQTSDSQGAANTRGAGPSRALARIPGTAQPLPTRHRRSDRVNGALRASPPSPVPAFRPSPWKRWLWRSCSNVSSLSLRYAAQSWTLLETSCQKRRKSEGREARSPERGPSATQSLENRVHRRDAERGGPRPSVTTAFKAARSFGRGRHHRRVQRRVVVRERFDTAPPRSGNLQGQRQSPGQLYAGRGRRHRCRPLNTVSIRLRYQSRLTSGGWRPRIASEQRLPSLGSASSVVNTSTDVFPSGRLWASIGGSHAGLPECSRSTINSTADRRSARARIAPPALHQRRSSASSHRTVAASTSPRHCRFEMWSASEGPCRVTVAAQSRPCRARGPHTQELLGGEVLSTNNK